MNQANKYNFLSHYISFCFDTTALKAALNLKTIQY